MLKPRQNPYDILSQLPTIFGTATEPKWALCWNGPLGSWSAFDCDSVDDLLEVALHPNWFAICVINPAELMDILGHARTDLISQSLHTCATLQRPVASTLCLSDFAPAPVDLPESNPDEVDS